MATPRSISVYGFPGLEPFDSDPVDSLAAEHFVRTGSTISSSNSATTYGGFSASPSLQ